MSWQGFPGRQLLKNQAGVHALSTNLPPAASPGARVRLLMERCGCAQGCSTAPAAWQDPGPAAGIPKGWFVLVYCGYPPALLAFPVLPSAGAAWGCCSLPCRCPRLGWGVQVPCPVLWLHTTQGSLAPIPGTCNGRGEMLLLLQGP